MYVTLNWGGGDNFKHLSISKPNSKQQEVSTTPTALTLHTLSMPASMISSRINTFLRGRQIYQKVSYHSPCKCRRVICTHALCAAVTSHRYPMRQHAAFILITSYKPSILILMDCSIISCRENQTNIL